MSGRKGRLGQSTLGLRVFGKIFLHPPGMFGTLFFNHPPNDVKDGPKCDHAASNSQSSGSKRSQESNGSEVCSTHKNAKKLLQTLDIQTPEPLGCAFHTI